MATTKQKIDPLTLFLMGKGQYATIKPSKAARDTPWRGMQSPSNPVFDRQQVEINRKLYPLLFQD